MRKKLRFMGYLSLLGLLILFFLISIGYLVLLSLASSWRWPDLLPQAFSTRAWSYVFLSPSGTWQAVGLSLQIALTVTLLDIALAIPAANALARSEFKGKGVIEALLFAPIIVPPFVAVMGMYMTFLRLDLTASVTGVILAHMIPTLPYVVRTLMVSYETLGFQWEEQARTLGAGRWQCFRHIVLPHILPGLMAGASLSILISFSQYLITLLVGEGQVMTLPLLLFPFVSGGDPSIGAVYTIVFACLGVIALWGTTTLLARFYGKRLKLHM